MDAMKERLIVLGSGGHCKVILDMLLEQDIYDVVGLIGPQAGGSVCEIPVVGTDDDLPLFYEQGVRKAFVAIGGNVVRKKLVSYLSKCGFALVNVISRHATISRYASMGHGNAVMAGAVIQSCAALGNGCIVNTNTSIDHDCVVGDFVHVAPGCAVSGSVFIGEGAFLGTGSHAIDSISIGAWSIVGSGAAVIRDIEPFCTAVGVPARIIRSNIAQ